MKVIALNDQLYYFINCIYLYILVTIIVGTEQQQLVMLDEVYQDRDLVELVTIVPISYSDVPGTSTPYLIWKKLPSTTTYILHIIPTMYLDR